MKSRLFSILALSGLFVAGALLLKRKHHTANGLPMLADASDQNVEDFTAVQQALLQRVREIWAEHCTS